MNTISNVSVLTISFVNATENGGLYECVAIYDDGFAVAQSVLYVYPLIVEHPQNQLAEFGQCITLKCRAESFPYSQYQWQRYNTVTQSFENITGQTGKEYSLLVSDYGDYRCMVTTPTIDATIFSNVSTISG